MDPDATWNELCAALCDNDLETAREHAGALLTWLGSGGFPPRDSSEAGVDDETLRFAVEKSCRAVLCGSLEGA